MTRTPIRAVTVLTAAVLAGALSFGSMPIANADTVTNPADVVTLNENPDPTTTEEPGTPDRGHAINLRKVFSSRSVNAIAAVRELAPFSYPGYFKTARYARWYAKRHVEHAYGWGEKQMSCLRTLWQGESSWRLKASGANGRYLGIPQLSKAIIKASNVNLLQYRRSVEIQVQLGAKYIKYREGYGQPCKALKHSQKKGWY